MFLWLTVTLPSLLPLTVNTHVYTYLPPTLLCYINLVDLVSLSLSSPPLSTYTLFLSLYSFYTLYLLPFSPHRVLLPDDEVRWGTVHQSMAFFVHPDNEVMVECIDGSNKYPPITAREDADRKLKSAYDYRPNLHSTQQHIPLYIYSRVHLSIHRSIMHAI